MRNLVDDFLVYLRHERGQSEQTQKTYAGLLLNFVAWVEGRGLHDWAQVKLADLTAFLEFERTRALKNQPEEVVRKLSSESLYLQIAALRAFYNFAEAEKFLPQNIAENLALPRRWKRLPKALSKLGNRAIAETGEAGNSRGLVRSGRFGIGLCFRPAPGRIARRPPGTFAVGGRVSDGDWQRQQGTRCSSGPQSGGGDPAVLGRRPAKIV